MVSSFDCALFEICDLEILLKEKKDLNAVIKKAEYLKDRVKNLLIPDVIKDNIVYLFSSVVDFYRINNETIMENSIGYYTLIDLIRTKFFAIRNYLIDIDAVVYAISDEDRVQKKLLLDAYVSPEEYSDVDVSKVYDYFSKHACDTFFKRYNEMMGISRKKAVN